MLFLRREQAAGNRLPTATIPVFLPTSISAQKMRFTETVDLLDARIFGDFDMMQVGELTKFLSTCGKPMIAAVKNSVNGAFRGGVQG
jgi:hypothetical protein